MSIVRSGRGGLEDKQMMVNCAVKENKAGILNFVLIWFFFYIELLQGGIATHDELLSIATTVAGSNKLDLSARWGFNLFHYPITLLQSSMPNYTLYRLWTIVGLMIACFFAMMLIYHHIDKKLCWVFPNVFVLLAQIVFEHDGLLAFGWGYQFDIALVFVSVDFFILYKKTQRKKYKLLSVMAYFVATMAYEAFAAFGIFLLIIDVIYMYSKNSLKLRDLINDLVLHFLLVLSYTVSFMVLSFFYESGDATIGNETSLMGYFQTLISYSIGLFPLRFKVYSFKQLLSLAFEISWRNTILWIVIIFFAKEIIIFLQKSELISLKKYLIYSVMSLIGMILPNIVVSMTSKFQQWIKMGVRTFGTSYYSYFFLIFWMVVTVAFLYHRIRFKKFFTGIIFLVFIFVARFTLYSNDYYLDELNKNQNRYEAFLSIIKSEKFCELPEDVQIYTDDYVGIHYNIDSLSMLATSVRGNSTKVLNDKTQLDWSMPVYYLNYDQEIEGVYLFEMLADNVANEVFIQSKDKLDHYYCLFHSFEHDALPTYVDGKLVGAYSLDVILSTLYTESNNVLIQHEGIDTESFKIQLGYNSVDSSIISLDGIYGIEEWGRWGKKNFVVNIDNVNNRESCRLDLVLSPGVQEDTKLNIEYSGKSEQYDIQLEGTEVQLIVPLAAGINKIQFSSEAEDIDVPADPRDMNMQISKLDIDYDGNIYQYSQ